MHHFFNGIRMNIHTIEAETIFLTICTRLSNDPNQ